MMERVGGKGKDKRPKKKEKEKEKRSKHSKATKEGGKEVGERGEGEGKIFRVLTYNVQRWVDCEGHNNLLRVIEIIQRLSPDVVGLQEVMYPYLIPNDASGKLKKHRGKPVLDALAAEVGMPHFIYGQEIYSSRHSAFYGNALLSKHPFKQTPTRHNIRGIAGLIVADIDVPAATSTSSSSASPSSRSSSTLRIGLTHLDPADEDLRVEQVHRAVLVLNQPELEESKVYWRPRKGDPTYDADKAQLAKQKEPNYSRDSRVPHILIGDLNAMRESDYTPEHWQHLIEFSKKKQWSPPRSSAMEAIDGAGYKDTFRVAGEGDLLTSWTDQPLFRIDYVLVSQDLDVKIAKCRRDNANASDHFPVYADLELAQ